MELLDFSWIEMEKLHTRRRDADLRDFVDLMFLLLGTKDSRYLRHVARKMWQYFYMEIGNQRETANGCETALRGTLKYEFLPRRDDDGVSISDQQNSAENELRRKRKKR